MTEKNFNIESDKEFDALIESSLGELPPEYVTDEVTPWKTAISRVLWGLALCSVTVNLFALDYILPAVGMILSLLGFRALRTENGNFKACYVISVMRTAAVLISVVLDATVYRSTQFGEILAKAITVFNVINILILLVCLKCAFIAVKEKAGLEGGVGGATALIIWEIIVLALALINYQGIIIPIITFIAYICIIKSLFTLSKELDEAGYAINAAPVRVSDKAFTVAICSVLAICIICGYVFFNAYPMKWAETQTAETAQITQIKENLLELGFPEDVLNDLSDEDILECAGAVHVVFFTEDFSSEEGVQNYLSSNGRLRLTSVGVKLPEDREKWRIFHHFEWIEKPWFYGTESIQLWPTYREFGDWYQYGELTGRVLYDRNGKTYTAPYPFLGTETYTNDTVFWGESDSTDVFASFSLPNGGENQRGYISYGIVAKKELLFVDSWVNYTHQITPLQYPVRSATEYRMYGDGYAYNFTFETVQHAIQYIPETNRTDISDESGVVYIEDES